MNKFERARCVFLKCDRCNEESKEPSKDHKRWTRVTAYDDSFDLCERCTHVIITVIQGDNVEKI